MMLWQVLIVIVRILLVRRNNNRGSVTVYIVLIFSVLLIMVTAVITVLRYESEKHKADISLDISHEAAFSKFFRPLLDNYGLFYYVTLNEETLRADISGYYLRNQKGISSMISAAPESIDVYQLYYATDNNAANVAGQMENVIKETMIEEKVKELADKYMEWAANLTGMKEELDDVGEDVEDIEEEAVKEEDMLKLLELVEGVYISDGEVKSNDNFVKSGVVGEVTATNVGIDSDIVWKTLQDRYWNIAKYPETIRSKALKVIEGKDVMYPAGLAKNWVKKLKMLCDYNEKAVRLAHSLTGINKGICNPELFEELLNANHSILERLIQFGQTNAPQSVSEWERIYEEADECLKLLKGYHVKELRFDYSSLNTKQERNPAEGIEADTKDIIYMFTENSADISKKTLTEACIYEQLIDCNNDEVVSQYDDYDFEDVSCLGKLIEECSNNVSGCLTDSLLLNLYIDRYFEGYTCDGIEENDSGKHALDYEQEYIICGHAADRDNLKGVVRRILYTRLGQSLVCLIADNASRQKAYATAAAVVGFTGLDALIRAVQYMIIAAWAYEDAMVDTGALLKGYKISAIKVKSDFNINFEEIALFSKEFLKTKIDKCKNNKGIDYEDCKTMLLFMSSFRKRLCRSMDIIQANMKKEYDSMFSFGQAIYGARTRVMCSKPFYYVADRDYCYE